ncbi:uncharacterized protein PG998_009772 [Apiospora kogelbergensis]|uniref:Uncharacterized protein n=1 Tax=Apiospora kogelbergensis TaxID=1337665 RepID=A0AAW0R8U8_9PEZI
MTDAQPEGRCSVAAEPGSCHPGPGAGAGLETGPLPSRLPSTSMGRLFGWRGVRSKATFLGGEDAVLSARRHWVAPRQVP